jgi:uncharacterized protein
MSVIIDRRLNDRNKSAVNRARFLRRYKEQIQRSVHDMVSERSIKDMERGGPVNIPTRDISEPAFRHGPGGDHEYVLPGNRKFNAGDHLPRPEGEGEGDGQGEGGEGDGQDSFSFVLSREEFMQLFFDDLELPRMLRTTLGEIKERKLQRAGYTSSGAPNNLSIPRSLRQALGRRIALSGTARRELAELEDQERKDFSLKTDPEFQARAAELRKRVERVPFLDEIDLRFRHRVWVPQPKAQAVMFCLMDVSASMDEGKKDLAKRFFTLLYMFLSRKYEKVEVIFIRHTDDAEEVDEDRFFKDPKTGGTVVLSALHMMRKIIDARFAPETWNIYGAQVSDGDAFGADPEKSRQYLQNELMPVVRHYAYIETADEGSRISTLSAAYRRVESEHFAMAAVRRRGDIYPVFRSLFAKEGTAA